MDVIEPVVRDAVAAIGRRDWDALKPLLHPYVHWTGKDGVTLRGRTKVLTRLAHARPTSPPLRAELRDGQAYRWEEGA